MFPYSFRKQSQSEPHFFGGMRIIYGHILSTVPFSRIAGNPLDCENFLHCVKVQKYYLLHFHLVVEVVILST
jgi:hypothetical protein